MLTLDFKNSKMVLLTALIGCSFALFGCDLTDDNKNDIADAFQPDLPAPPNDPWQDSTLCEIEEYQQPQAEIVKKVDILFVTDTSGSLNTERGQIADGIDAFVAELPDDVDFNVGVMYAHGTESNNPGELVGSPQVLSSESMSVDDIRTQLRNRMVNPVGEYATDGGEVGLYSFTRALTDKLATNQALGFLRDDAALAVIFVADENAICALDEYPEGVTPVYDPNKLEFPALENFCDGISAESVSNLVKDVKGEMPYLVSGIIYNGDSPVPSGGENEIGYGYLEAIELSNGIDVDLASGNYDVGMREIGYLTYQKLNLLTEFNLQRDDFILNTLEVFVDRSLIDFNYVESLNQVQIASADAGGALSEVLIRYCIPLNPAPDILNLRIFRITFTSADIEWETNQPTTRRLVVTNVATGDSFELVDNNLANYHNLRISGLTTNVTYSVEVIATNPEGTSSSQTIQFTTLDELELLL